MAAEPKLDVRAPAVQVCRDVMPDEEARENRIRFEHLVAVSSCACHGLLCMRLRRCELADLLHRLRQLRE